MAVKDADVSTITDGKAEIIVAARAAAVAPVTQPPKSKTLLKERQGLHCSF